MTNHYYQVVCKNCKHTFNISVEQQKKVMCNCPFCQKPTIVTIPKYYNNEYNNRQIDLGSIDKQRRHKEHLTVIVIFVIAASLIIIIFSLLYTIFKSMSNS